jgi:serine/threonine protein kinase
MIGDYHVGKRIATLSGAYLHHAHLRTGERVVLKQPQSNTITPAQLSRFPREYELLRSLDVDGIVKPRALAGEPTRPVIVLDYFDGESLETFLDRTCLDVGTCLRLGRELADTLASLHAAGIMHRDIRPANLWLTSPPQHLLLLDISLASDMQGAARDNDASGDWAYVSPEQTGRMNRPVDYRTDMYSLGLTLYRMLTGRLPFTAEDPLEWAHCHVARLPSSPRDLDPAIPHVVSDIVMKLLAKLPEDRYQSMHGVQFDLDRCLAQWRPDGEISPFVLGSEDFSGQFYIPYKLYGREREAASLHEAFTQVTETGQPRLVTVSGYAGIGKSALVNELQQPIVRECGYFISGKFDQYLHNIPYATLQQAFQDLIRQLLSESEARMAQWRRDIQAAVGIHGQLVVDILPQVELLIGQQPPVTELLPAEAQNRFRRVFRQFLAVFAKSTHPLVLFLDDLQWIDAASLQLVESLLIHADTRYLLLIGTYRDNEVNAAHPLLSGIQTIRRAGVPVR